ncbi:MAG: hypothetical protein HQ509_08480 [Candidatus Marinimicrobia bacterium]|nr:hypothetical protein [Candidatus Neomarinimicrobiota bacterium]
MWILQLFAAWMLLYWAFRLMIVIGRKHDDNTPPMESESGLSDSESGYLKNNPDVLRPDIEPDEFNLTDYF